MAASFVAYIDESGDEGFAFYPNREGSSRWFVLAAALTRKTVDLETVKLVDSVRAVLGFKKGKPLHFRDMKHEHRVAYIDHIAKARVRVLGVAIHKPSLKEPETFQRDCLLYHFAARLLLERLSWCCRDHHVEGQGNGGTEIVFSNRASISYERMREYFELLKRQSEVGDVRIDWNFVDPQAVRALNHDASMGLQIADAVASAIYYGVQVNRQGYNEPRYVSMLRPVVYSHKGRKLGNGLKLWPHETDALLTSEPELAWVTEFAKR